MQLPNIPIDWSFFDGSNIIIQRHVASSKTALGESVMTLTQIYAGSANVYDKQAMVMDANVGLIADERITALLEPGTSGALPTIQVGDLLTVLNPGDGTPQHEYLIEHVHVWDAPPFSIELSAKLSAATKD